MLINVFPVFTFLVPAHPGSRRQNPEGVVVVVAALNNFFSKYYNCYNHVFSSANVPHCKLVHFLRHNICSFAVQVPIEEYPAPTDVKSVLPVVKEMAVNDRYV